jgi:outer membrane biogenesis lipoprotein LolB
MTVAKGTILLLLFVLLPSCAGQFQRQDASAEKAQQEQKKEKDPPTFT